MTVLVLGFFLAFALFPVQALRGANLANGKEIYVERCVLCHGVGGERWNWEKKAVLPPVPVPDLTEAAAKRSDEFLLAVIRDGGEAVGLTRFMPAFGFNMSEQELRDVVAYLRSLRPGEK